MSPRPNALDAAYCALAAAALPAFAWKRLRHGKYRESVPGMLGKRLPDRALAPPAQERAWLHAVSVGEAVAAGAVHARLRAARPGWEFLATTTTETGQAQARRSIEGAQHFAYAPFDFSWTVDAFLRAYRPSLYLFFETEIWPNLLAACGRRGMPVFLANAKMSDRSAGRYARARRLFAGPLSHVARFYAQTQADAERIDRVIRDPSRIVVTGNVKFDALPKPLDPRERAEWRRRLGAPDGAVLLLAGSTHPGEESIVAKAFAEARRSVPALRLALAPRHPERFAEAAEILGRVLGPVHRASASPQPPGNAAAVVLDEMGVLGRAFGACDIALLGGSWAPIGGHNLLEPACHGVPVLRGPHMHAQREIVRVLGPEQGAPCVEEEDLPREIARLAADDGERKRLGALAARAAESNRGAAGRVVEDMLATLDALRGA